MTDRSRGQRNVAPDGEIQFRPLADDDLPLLHRWLNEPGVVRWWEGDDVSEDAVARDYGSAATGPTEFWIASASGRDVGWIQCYASADYPDEDEVKAWRGLGAGESTGGIDYLIGDPADRGKGLGARMIRSFVEDIVFPRHPTWTHVAASPVAANVASWKALENAGFAYSGTFDSPHGPCRLMVRPRASGPRR